MYFLIIKLLFFVCLSAAVAAAERLNYTRRIEKMLNSQLYKPSVIDSVEPWRGLREISHLPEDDYASGLGDDDSSSYNDFPEIDRDNRNLLPDYRSLCQTRTRRVDLSDSEFEYQPPHYHEVYCKSYSLIERVQALTRPSQQMCAHPSFHCVQRSKTLFVVRRRWESECWEPHSMQVPSGCECMWPVSSLGEITGHY